MEAALAPAKGDYVFFVTISKNGSALFTKDFKAFNAAAAKARAEGVF